MMRPVMGEFIGWGKATRWRARKSTAFLSVSNSAWV